MLRDHGSSRKYEHPVIGWNARMDGLQGAVLSVKLRHLEAANEARRAHAHRYKELLADCAEAVLPFEAAWGRHVFHIFALQCERRDALMKHLTEQGVGCGIHYPKPLHLQDAYAFLGKGPGSFPVAEGCANQYVSLPMFPELTEGQIQYTVNAVRSGLRSKK
jgi:dTDP-4-amino-4,6-dideoxygalactose transaminase